MPGEERVGVEPELLLPVRQEVAEEHVGISAQPLHDLGALLGKDPLEVEMLCRKLPPDFAGPVVGPAFQQWFRDPSSVDGILESLQEQWDALPPL